MTETDIRTIDWPEAPEKGDAADFIAAGGDVEALLEAARRRPRPTDAPVTTGNPQAAPALRFRTAKELSLAQPLEVEWTVEGLVAPGAITEILGKAKSAGKTTFIAHMVAAILSGRPFIGFKTSRTSVGYLTEQSYRTFRAVLERAGLLESEDLHILTWAETLGMTWEQVAEEAVAEAVRLGLGLLIIDTLPQFAGIHGDGENSSGEALRALRPLQVAAAVDGLAVMVVRHERKAGGDVGDAGRGSSAFAGAVDLIVALRRPQGNAAPTVRELSAISRFDETPDELMIELRDDGYHSLGEKDHYEARRAQDAVLDALPAAEDAAMTVDEVKETTELGRTSVQQAIKELVDRARIFQTGAGRRGDPRRYWRRPMEPAGFGGDADAESPDG